LEHDIDDADSEEEDDGEKRRWRSGCVATQVRLAPVRRSLEGRTLKTEAVGEMQQEDEVVVAPPAAVGVAVGKDS